MTKEVLYAKEDRIAFITINRPEVKNALNMAVFRGLEEVLDKVSVDDEVRALVITGAGNFLVAGADINELFQLTTEEGWVASRYQQSVFNKLERLRKPAVAAINGFAMGGGLELALSCTFRLASTKARLGFPELGLGVIPAFGGTQRLVRTVGYGKASELILFRTIVSGEEAFQMGLVTQVVEPDQIGPKARQWADDLASLSPTAVRLEMELLNNVSGQGFDEGLALESALASLAVASPDAKGLLGAFVSKGSKGDK